MFRARSPKVQCLPKVQITCILCKIKTQIHIDSKGLTSSKVFCIYHSIAKSFFESNYILNPNHAQNLVDPRMDLQFSPVLHSVPSKVRSHVHICLERKRLNVVGGNWS